MRDDNASDGATSGKEIALADSRRLAPRPRRAFLRAGVASVAGFAAAFMPFGRNPLQMTPTVLAGGCAEPTGDCHAHCYCECSSGTWACYAPFWDQCFQFYYIDFPCCKFLACGPCDGRFLFDCTPCGCSFCQQFNCA